MTSRLSRNKPTNSRISRSRSSADTSNSATRDVSREENVVPAVIISHARVATSFMPKYVPEPRCNSTASPSSTRDNTSGGQVRRSFVEIVASAMDNVPSRFGLHSKGKQAKSQGWAQ